PSRRSTPSGPDRRRRHVRASFGGVAIPGCPGIMRHMVPSEESILTNLRRGALEYCVLALLANGESYGLHLARRLVDDGVLIGGEGTLYPLLARLRKSGLVSTSWRESDA